MDISGDYIVFRSGKRVYANRGIIGIGPDMGVSYGYDGGIYSRDDGYDSGLSSDDLAELADYMVDKWSSFKRELGNF